MLDLLLLFRKIIMQLIFPPGGIIIFLLLICLLIVLNRKKIATCLFVFLIFVLFLLSSWLGEYILLRPLEDNYNSFNSRYHNNIRFSSPIIVVLGGGIIENSVSGQDGKTDIGEVTLARLYGAYNIYREIQCPILVSGGSVPGHSGNIPAAQVMHEVLINFGVPGDEIYQEGESRTTIENATYTIKQIKTYGHDVIILVTSAVHMRRSVEAFKNDEVHVIPAPVNYLFENTKPGILNILPNEVSWDHNLRAIHEWIGLIFYKLLSLK
jgi:uncharacterized SAM-binding protein YcdF (DUF218 family)